MQQVWHCCPLAHTAVLHLFTPSTESFSLFLRSTRALSRVRQFVEFRNGLRIFGRDFTCRNLLYRAKESQLSCWARTNLAPDHPGLLGDSSANSCSNFARHYSCHHNCIEISQLLRWFSSLCLPGN